MPNLEERFGAGSRSEGPGREPWVRKRGDENEGEANQEEKGEGSRRCGSQISGNGETAQKRKKKGGRRNEYEKAQSKGGERIHLYQ